MKFYFIYILFLIGFANSIFAQNNIGLNLNIEANNEYGTINPLIGLNYKHSIKKGKISTGVLLRTFTNKYNHTVVFPGNANLEVAQLSITSFYLSVPLLYQFNTKIVNIAVGPSYDIYLGHRHKTSNKNINVTNFKAPNELGFVLNLNKEFKFSEKINVVPEFRIQRLFESSTSFYSIGCALQY